MSCGSILCKDECCCLSCLIIFTEAFSLFFIWGHNDQHANRIWSVCLLYCLGNYWWWLVCDLYFLIYYKACKYIKCTLFIRLWLFGIYIGIHDIDFILVFITLNLYGHSWHCIYMDIPNIEFICAFMTIKSYGYSQ